MIRGGVMYARLYGKNGLWSRGLRECGMKKGRFMSDELTDLENDPALDLGSIEVPGEGIYKLQRFSLNRLPGSSSVYRLGTDQSIECLKEFAQEWLKKNKDAVHRLRKIYGEDVPSIPLTCFSSSTGSTLPDADQVIGDENLDRIVSNFQGIVPYVTPKALDDGVQLHKELIDFETKKIASQKVDQALFDVEILVPSPLDVSRHRTAIDEFNLTFWKEMYVNLYRSAIIRAHEENGLEYENVNDNEFPYGPITIQGSFGSPTHPVLIPSDFESRLVGCEGGAGPRGHELLWHNVKRSKPTVCLECGQVFRLVSFDDWIRWAAREFVENKQDTVSFFLPASE